MQKMMRSLPRPHPLRAVAAWTIDPAIHSARSYLFPLPVLSVSSTWSSEKLPTF
jgi:hypothetical protein